jgi:hypothetical protein
MATDDFHARIVLGAKSRKVADMGSRVACLACCLFVLAACSDLASMPRPPGIPEQCQAWGYAPDDPACTRLFRRDPP